MPQHGFSLTPIIPHKERIEDSALAETWVRENPYSGVVYAVLIDQK